MDHRVNAVARRAGLAMVVVIAMTPVASAQSAGAAAALQSLLVGDGSAGGVISSAQLFILERALAIGINTLPTETSSSPATEKQPPFRQNYGPLYLERATTVGRGTLESIVTFQRANWTGLDGIDLDGDHLANHVPGFLGRPGVDSRVSLALSSETVTFGATYGLPKRVDVGFTLPIQRVCATGVRTVTLTPGGVQSIRAASCSAGLGDVQVKSRYSVDVGSHLTLAAAVSLSMATGDVERLTGKGETQPTFVVAASKPTGVFQPHVNLGATLGGHGVHFTSVDFFGSPSLLIDRISASRSFNYGFGTNVVFGPTWTLSFEAAGRELRHGVVFNAVDVLSGGSLETTPVDWQSVIIGSAGAKRRIGDHVVVSGHVTRQFSDAGLRFSWVGGLSLTATMDVPRR